MPPGHSDGGSPDAHRLGGRGLLSAARGRSRARAQPRPPAEQLGAPDHGGHVPHGRPSGRRVRAPGGNEPGDLFERRRVPRDHRLAAAGTAGGAVPSGPLRHRARARRGRRPMDTLGEHPRLLFLGRIEPRNGLGTLLDAMPRILARFPGAVLTVVGDGPWRRYYVRWARELGPSVRFVGQVLDNRPAYY